MEQTATEPSVPLPSDSFTHESMGTAGLEAYARALSQTLKVVPEQESRRALAARRRREIRQNLDTAADVIERAYMLASDMARAGESLMTDAEWLLDNFYVVDELIRDIREHMPASFLSELPSVASGRPRVYEIARELVSHSDSALDEGLLERFIENFQSDAVLSIGETWAFPVMLRLVLLEHLKALSERFLFASECRVSVADLLKESPAPSHFDLDSASIAHCGPKILELSEQLRGRGEEGTAALKVLERQVHNLGWELSDLIRLEHRRQAANQVSIGNVITSMRLLSTLDWIGFFEHTNRAEQVLRRDPVQLYTQMDFASRNRYRTVVERIGKGSHTADHEVAQEVLATAEGFARTQDDRNDLRAHVGFWLVGPGAAEFERARKVRRPASSKIAETIKRYPELTYFGSLALLILLGLTGVVLAARALDIPVWARFAISVLALLPLSDVALSMVNSLLPRLVPPRLLPKLEFENGIPTDYPTIVVVPSLLSSRREAENLVDRLENHFLANSDRMLRFALLTDFADAATAETRIDAELLAVAVTGVRELNARHGDATYQPFYLFHRQRKWNASEGVWMGWERKRGKLMEFGRLLRGDTGTSYIVREGDLKALEVVRQADMHPFIITLDADTVLPRDTARRLVGTLAHPLNRPQLSADGKRVESGYTILQPRVSVHLAGARQTRFVETFANSPGLDPYTTAASDVYQDLFGEGSFTGKGIYDLHAFERALAEAFPENSILSHDLIEGCHARVALVSDIEVYDSFPTRYDADMKRTHRWVRGDWQIAPWLFPKVPYASGWQSNRLSLLSRWKIVDNLRRSLSAPSLLALLITAWFCGGQIARLGSVFGLIVLFWPVALHLLNAALDMLRQKYVGYFVRHIWEQTLRTFEQCLLQLVFLMHRSVVMFDAIVRTFFRMFVSRKRMLQWETAAAVENRLSNSRWGIFQQMWYCPVASIAIFAAAPSVSTRWAALPFVVAWLVAPLVAFVISQPRRSAVQTLAGPERQWLRQWASATWSYFEAYVNEESNWLPPDNVQDYPREKIAYRISPTNEGLFLVSAIAARDFGIIGVHSLVELWERNWETWQRLEKLHGHHYNWYETRSLASLPPRYVSTVDSGNLAACLLTLHSGINDDLLNAPILDRRVHMGMLDSIDWLEAAVRHVFTENLTAPQRQQLDDLLRLLLKLRRGVHTEPMDSVGWRNVFLSIESAVLNLSTIAHSLRGDALTVRLSKKIQLVRARFAGLRQDVDSLLPWIMSDPQQQIDAVSSTTAENSLNGLGHTYSLRQLAQFPSSAAERPVGRVAQAVATGQAGQTRSAPEEFAQQSDTALRTAIANAAALVERYEALASAFEQSARDMDFQFLYNHRRKLFSIGFNVEESRLDRSHYDMLCSESRLASYLAIAKGDTETNHWFRLGRQSTQVNHQSLLVSWGGTMFEYMMPPLFQKQYPGSLLTESCHGAIRRQQAYARERGVPWGISESAYSSLAANSDYLYRSFGTPGLGLKRGLAKDLVISPYSTMLALPLEPVLAIENLRALVAEGAAGDWGFYEALDYTPGRLRRGKRVVPVECYMAHHQGMSLTALANVLFDNVMQRRFHEHPWARANELLLQERIPQLASPSRPTGGQLEQAPINREEGGLVSRRITGIQTPTPRTHLLSNGQTSVMVSHVGGGYTQWQDQLVTRWRSDGTRDNWGTFIYLHDVDSDELWSPTYQPTLVAPDAYEVIFAMDKAEFHRRQGDIESLLEVAVSPENNADVRQLRLANRGTRERRINVTSYAEIVLNTPNADMAHPAFQKLFIETEYIAEETTLIARRRPRSAGQEALYAVHTVVASGDSGADVQFETSRHSFLGRNRSSEQPAGARATTLSGSVGAVLDPIFALRCQVTLAPDEAVTISFTTAVAQSREQALVLADQYHDQRGTHRAFELAWAFAQTESRHGNLDSAKLHLFQRLGSALLYPDGNLRGEPSVLVRNRMSQPGLWRYGISGDLPIIVCRVTDTEQLELVAELLAAQRFLIGHGLFCDLVILNDYPGSYFDAVQDQLQSMINDAQIGERRYGAIHLLRAAQLPSEDRVLIETVAACVLSGEAGTLAQQLDSRTARRPTSNQPAPVELLRVDGPSAYPAEFKARVPLNMEFANGIGGFVNEGRAYALTVSNNKRPPAPWSNVIANARLGTLVTESGSGFTWFLNSRENKLTTWSNDSVGDPPSEIIYLRDEEAGELWSPLAGLTAAHGNYDCQHAQGYSRFQHVSHGLEQEVLIAVAETDPIKFVRLRIHNSGARARRLALTYYVEWVLGVTRSKTDMMLVTEKDEQSGALLVRNRYSIEFADQVAFLQVLSPQKTVCGDRRSFIGRNGSPSAPRALSHTELDGITGAGLDPCGAIQTHLFIDAGTTAEIFVLLGAGENLEEARALLTKYAQPDQVGHAIDQATQAWRHTLGALQVETPNRALDILVNGWLQYQTLSCRVWGRSAFYQSGGAYGFRDQLQDVMALVNTRPELTREQILRAAARQFKEGDVQHWWHPPGGKGTRTRFSDDFLFLPYVTDFYIRATGDKAILDEVVPFVVSAPLHENEQERYEHPQVSHESATLYEHCRLALEHGRRYGEHGLPLMGCGDWNDGMNKVGEEGRGESVWVAFFQIVVFEQFAAHMRDRGDDQLAAIYVGEAKRLRGAVEEHAWDGQWYRRAFFDDGRPLGSHQNAECRIDSLSQSWAVIAGAQPERARQAMQSAVQELVRDTDGLVLLFTPPFDRSDLDPGYIKGYLPGIRENGGQYTHAATWMVDAAARMGDGNLAMRLFDLINPINHARTAGEVARYRVEPYVIAADVYSVQPHVGRGGWSWYTGSASWTYRVAVESMLGIVINGSLLSVRPCVPDSWDQFAFTYRRGTTSWHVTLQRSQQPGQPFTLELVEDGKQHDVTGKF